MNFVATCGLARSMAAYDVALVSTCPGFVGMSDCRNPTCSWLNSSNLGKCAVQQELRLVVVLQCLVFDSNQFIGVCYSVQPNWSPQTGSAAPSTTV